MSSPQLRHGWLLITCIIALAPWFVPVDVPFVPFGRNERNVNEINDLGRWMSACSIVPVI
jgi:hypothetical protein